MFENLALLYRQYGGASSLLSSGYFRTAALFTLITALLSDGQAWPNIAQSILPSLIGFSVASFAIIVAVLTKKQIEALLAPDAMGKSPLLKVSASIGHAVFIQIVALLLASIFDLTRREQAYNFCRFGDSVDHCRSFIDVIADVFDIAGLFLLFYGLLLVLAAVLSIFRMIMSLSNSITKSHR